MTQLQQIPMAILVFFIALFAAPALAGEWGDHDQLTSFYAEQVAAFGKPDCPAGLTCPDTENTIGGIRSSVLVAQSGGYAFHANELQGYFASTFHALRLLAELVEKNHLIEFHAADVGNFQQLREIQRDIYSNCVHHLTIALGRLQAHQRKHNFPQSIVHPVFPKCPSK